MATYDVTKVRAVSLKLDRKTARTTIIIILSGFGIYGAAVVPDSGVGNT